MNRNSLTVESAISSFGAAATARLSNVAAGGKPLVDGLRCSPETTSVHNFTIPVELAVMAPDVTKIDPYRHLELGMPACNFSNGVLRWLLHGNSLSPKDLLIPFLMSNAQLSRRAFPFTNSTGKGFAVPLRRAA